MEPTPSDPADASVGPAARSRRILLWLVPLGVPALLAAWVMSLHAQPYGQRAGAEPIRAAYFAVVDESGRAGAATPVALPHGWKDTHPAVARGRYTIPFTLDAPGRAPASGPALFLPGVNTRAEVRVNGNLLGSAADVPGLASRHWLVPLYRSIPEALLEPGENRLEIELAVDVPGTGVLSPAYVGDAADLRAAFDLRHFMQVSGIQVLVIAMVSFGAFLGLLSLLRRKDTTYFWFGLGLWMFAFGFWNLLAIETRFPRPPYRWVGAVSMAWMTVVIVVFVHRLLDERHVRLEATLASVVVAGSVFFWLALDSPVFSAVIPFWGAFVLLMGVYASVRVVMRFVRRPDREMALVVTTGVFLFAAGFHDIALVNGAFGLGHDFAIQHAAWAGVGIFAFIFVTRFIDALDTSEALSADLAERVEQKAAEIEASHARLRVFEQERAIAHERERILGEIHDGMGGQLVSALALVRSGEGEREETAEAIQAALDDMRLMIHSLDDVEGDLGMLLGSLRDRIGRRLERSGLRLEWQIGDTPEPADFGPESALQVMRIAQEAITNAIKHAEASTLVVRTTAEAAGAERVVVLEIRDDGGGFDATPTASGRGLSHMSARAERIGGTLEITSGEAGTCVRLLLPAPGG